MTYKTLNLKMQWFIATHKLNQYFFVGIIFGPWCSGKFLHHPSNLTKENYIKFTSFAGLIYSRPRNNCSFIYRNDKKNQKLTNLQGLLALQRWTLRQLDGDLEKGTISFHN